MTTILQADNEGDRNYANSRSVHEWKASAVEELALARFAISEDRYVNAQGYLWRAIKYLDAATIRGAQPEVQP